MRTRNSYFPNNSNVTIPRRRNKGRAPNIVEPELRTIVAPMAERTMEELLRAPTDGMNATSSKMDERIDKLADQLSTLVEIVSKKVITPAPVKAIEETCITCGGAHFWYNCPATDNNLASVCVTTGTYNQVNPPNRVSNQMAPPGFAPVQNNGQNRSQVGMCLLMNKEKLLELAKIPLNENCSAMLLKKLPEKLEIPATLELLGFSNSSSGNPTPTSELFTSEFILEEIEAYLKDDSISPKIDYADCNPEEDILIIAKGLKDDEKDALLKVLKSHKRAIAWKITDIKGIDPRFCTHKILMEDDYKPTVQSQRRVNPKIHEVIKKEVLKLLDAGMIYPISDSLWVSPVHCVPKKGGITVVANEENE
ncbi:hypothetical protein Tco_0870505 [Tanacetum coccineum]